MKADHLKEAMEHLFQARVHLSAALKSTQADHHLTPLVADLQAAQAMVRKIHVLIGTNRAAIEQRWPE
jgi:hypothetical protein